MLRTKMPDDHGKLRIINEITGNWYDFAKGPEERFVYKVHCIEEPFFTKLTNNSLGILSSIFVRTHTIFLFKKTIKAAFILVSYQFYDLINAIIRV